jgi:tetratricopeptide (TPR) repeat protein
MKKLLFVIVFFVINFSFCKGQQYTIKQIDSLISHAESFSQQAPNNAIFLNKRNYKISQEANYPAGMVKSLSMLSICYLSKGNYEVALQYAKQAEEKGSEINDYKSVCTGLRISAMCYFQLGFDKEPEENITKAFSIIKKIPDSDDYYQTRGNLYRTKVDIIVYGKNPVLSELFKYTRNAIGEFSKIKNDNIRNNTLGAAYSDLGLLYSSKKMYDSANYYMTKSLHLANICDNTGNEAVALYGLASISYHKKEYQQTINYLEQVIPLCKKINEPFLLRLSYHTMQSSYEHMGNKEKDLEYLSKYTKLNDSLIAFDKATIDGSIQKIIKEDKETFIDEKEKLYLLIAVIFSLSALAVWFGYKSFSAYNQERKQKQQKQNVIEEKESQLTELQQKVNIAFEEVLELAKKDDSSFLTRFREVYPDFIQKLTYSYPSITSGQLKFCALLKLNFSTKEIAYYNNISIRSVEIKKSRLRKQLNISSSEDLNKWMINF